jgi:hypothetical protein
MTKEQLQLLRDDFPTYAKVNIKIIDKDGNLVPLILNRMQRMLWKLILTLIQQGKPIRIYLIKARQLGSTTFFCAFMYWLMSLNPNKRALGIAQNDDAAANLNKRWQDYYINSLPELRPRNRKLNSEEIHFATPLKDIKSGATDDPGLNSILEVQTAKDINLARSFTYPLVLITEICQLPGLGIDVKQMMIGLRAAVPRRKSTAVFLESTARGENYTKKMWDNPKNGYEKIFVSYCADDAYRNDLDWNLKYFQLSELEDSEYGDEVKERQKILRELVKWYPEDEFKQCLKDGNLSDFPQADEMEKPNYQVWLHHESYCRLSWRRVMIDEECEGDKDKFRQEYPTTVEDAFGVSSKSVFGAIKLLESKEHLRNLGLRTYRFSYRHPVDVKLSSVRDVLFPFSKGSLRIYEPPQQGQIYVCGADCSHGNPDSDDSAFMLLRLATELNKLVEVASFNDKIEATEFAGLLYIICNWYNHALLGVERNNVGIAVVENLAKVLRYRKLYYHYNKDPLDKRYTSSIKYGIDVEGPNRQILVRDGITFFKQNYIIIRSMEVLEQMDTFVENPKTGKIEASAGNLDDLVMCKLIAEQMSKQVHIRTEIPDVKELPYGSMGWYTRMADKRQGVKHDYSRKKSGMRKSLRKV